MRFQEEAGGIVDLINITESLDEGKVARFLAKNHELGVDHTAMCGMHCAVRFLWLDPDQGQGETLSSESGFFETVQSVGRDHCIFYHTDARAVLSRAKRDKSGLFTLKLHCVIMGQAAAMQSSEAPAEGSPLGPATRLPS